MKHLIKRLFDAFTQPIKTERKKNLHLNPSPFTWLMPSLTSRFFFMSMFLYLLWLPTNGSLAVSVISFVLNLYLSLLASCMGRGNSISCFSYVIGSWLRFNGTFCIGIGLHGLDTAFTF